VRRLVIALAAIALIAGCGYAMVPATSPPNPVDIRPMPTFTLPIREPQS
jgi:hypothetical protein